MEDPNKKQSFIERMLDLQGITDEEERKQRIKEHEENVEKLKAAREKRLEFFRPFIKKLQIFTENDIYQYIKKEKDNPVWVRFKIVKRYLWDLAKYGELEISYIYQEEPRPNTAIYYIPDISAEWKKVYIDCVEECNKLKTNCHEKLLTKSQSEV